MALNNLSPLQRQTIYSLSWLAFIFIITLSIVITLKTQISLLAKESVDNRLNNAAALAQIEDQARLRHQFSQIKDISAPLSKALPSLSDLSEIIDTLESLCAKQKIAVAIKIETPTLANHLIGNNQIYLVPYRLNLANLTVDSIKNLITDTEKLPYFISTDTFSLNSSGANGWNDNSNAIITGHFYAQR
jgi:hypothetical protein